MKPQLSLKWFLLLSFLSIGIVLVIGYSLLAAHFFVLGMDNILAGNMDKAARSYIAEVPAERRKSLNQFSGYLISHHWRQMPVEIQRAVGKPPDTPGEMRKYDDSGWLRPPDVVYFVMCCKPNGETLFVVSRISRSTASALTGRNAIQSQRMLLTISALIALILIVMVRLLFRRVSRPMAALGRWARELNKENLDKVPPDFSYPELNELAQLIRTSLSSVQESLAREHRFLRHASHELRTPISVIHNNIELLHKMETEAEFPLDPRHLQVINRIERASLTMKHLTETLLWLSRKAPENLSETPVALDSMIRQLADEMEYLLKDKDVSVHLSTAPGTIPLPEVPVRIVLGNLIRNAFQHTFKGEVVIQQQQNRVKIVNDRHAAESRDDDLGFGLGLQLTAQLTTRLGWTFINEKTQEHHRTEVIFKQTLKGTRQ